MASRLLNRAFRGLRTILRVEGETAPAFIDLSSPAPVVIDGSLTAILAEGLSTPSSGQLAGYGFQGGGTMSHAGIGNLTSDDNIYANIPEILAPQVSRDPSDFWCWWRGAMAYSSFLPGASEYAWAVLLSPGGGIRPEWLGWRDNATGQTIGGGSTQYLLAQPSNLQGGRFPCLISPGASIRVGSRKSSVGAGDITVVLDIYVGPRYHQPRW